MTGNVIDIGDRTVINQSSTPDAEVIDLLRAILARAESGDLQSVFVVGYLTPNEIVSGWEGASKGVFTLLGGIQQCLLDYQLKEFERR